jgi:hypothetical protein
MHFPTKLISLQRFFNGFPSSCGLVHMEYCWGWSGPCDCTRGARPGLGSWCNCQLLSGNGPHSTWNICQSGETSSSGVLPETSPGRSCPSPGSPGGVAWDVLGLANGLAPMNESQYAVSSPEVKKPDPSRQWLAFSDNTKSEN